MNTKNKTLFKLLKYVLKIIHSIINCLLFLSFIKSLYKTCSYTSHQILNK